MFLTLILISTLAEGVTDTNKLSFFLTIHEKYSWYRNQSSQPLPSDFAIRVYSPDIITFLLSLWIFGKYKNLQTFSVDLKNIKRFMLIYMYIKRMCKSYRWWITVVSHLRVTSGQLIFQIIFVIIEDLVIISLIRTVFFLSLLLIRFTGILFNSYMLRSLQLHHPRVYDPLHSCTT